MKAPRSIGAALRQLRTDAAPATLLGAVQCAWAGVAGEPISSQAQPVSERAGVVTVACRSATWANELDLLQSELLARLNADQDVKRHRGVAKLRFTADAARHDDGLL